MKNKSLILVSAALALVLVVGTVAIIARVRHLASSPSAQVAAPVLKAGNLSIGDAFPTDLVVKDGEGKQVNLSSFNDGEHFVVYTFHHPDCPCAANCGALIGEMGKAGYSDVRVIGIMAEGMDDERVMTALKEQRESGAITFPVYFDEGQTVMNRLGATRTPEMWLVDKEGKVRYWGAPENTLFPGTPGHRYYLREAVDALRAGKSPEVTSAKPIGCIIGG
ncbi:redoxin domain-containing protein [bacterium]|nr:redoxin domain-containing protein [bacterium]